MKPEIPKVLEVVAAKLIFEIAPSVTPSYRQSSIGVTAMLLGIVREEWDRAAARRVEENASLRALFGDASSVVTTRICVAGSKPPPERSTRACWSPSSRNPTTRCARC